MVRSWRKDFKRQSGMLEHVEDKNRNYFVYPEALLKLKAIEEQLNDVSLLYDKSVKTGRSIASETDMNDVFLDHVRDLKETVKKLK
jgi:predicted patatin/cPLA2 family phospholipase